MRILDRTIFAPVAAVRPYLALKLTLLFLAFDMWIERASHAGRYGAGGFNVAHFPLLDSIQPDVSPAIYIGICVLTGGLALMIVFGDRAPRWLLALTCVVYTWSWSMSMLDSYQHHYLLSLVLLCMTFFPAQSAEDAFLLPAPTKRKAKSAKAASAKTRGRKKSAKKTAAPKKDESAIFADFPYASAWAYVLLGASIAVVYAYTAFAKTDPEWLSGAALQRVLNLPEGGIPLDPASDPIGPFRAIFATFGIEGPTFWYTMGHSVVLVQIICSSGYLLAPLRDLTTNRIVRGFCWVAFFTALSFHAGAEYMDLKIGWFSWYMMGYAVIFFLPARWLVVAARVAIPLRGVQYGVGPLAVLILVALVLGGVGIKADLPFVAAFATLLILAMPLRYFTRAMWLEKLEQLPNEVALAFAGLAAVVLVGAGYEVDLPGARVASIVLAVGLGVAVVALLVARGDAKPIYGYSVGAIVAGLVLLASVVSTEIRWDYYRNVGGDHRRRGEPLEAYNAYVKANLYAPDGEDRLAKQREMREILVRTGQLPPEAP